MAPYKSEAQRKYIHWAESKGKIKSSTVKEFDEASKGKVLPERLHKVKKIIKGK